MSKEGPEKLGKDSSGSLRKAGWGPGLLLLGEIIGFTEDTTMSLDRGESSPKNSGDGLWKVSTGWTIGSG